MVPQQVAQADEVGVRVQPVRCPLRQCLCPRKWMFGSIEVWIVSRMSHHRGQVALLTITTTESEIRVPRFEQVLVRQAAPPLRTPSCESLLASNPVELTAPPSLRSPNAPISWPSWLRRPTVTLPLSSCPMGDSAGIRYRKIESSNLSEIAFWTSRDVQRRLLDGHGRG